MKDQSREDEIRKRWNDCQGLTEAEIEALLRLLDEARRDRDCLTSANHPSHCLEGCVLCRAESAEAEVKRLAIEAGEWANRAGKAEAMVSAGQQEVAALKVKLAPMEAHIGLQDDELIAKEAFCKKAEQDVLFQKKIIIEMEAEVTALKANLTHHWELVKDLKARLSERQDCLTCPRRAEEVAALKAKLAASEKFAAEAEQKAVEWSKKLSSSEKAREEAKTVCIFAEQACHEIGCDPKGVLSSSVFYGLRDAVANWTKGQDLEAKR